MHSHLTTEEFLVLALFAEAPRDIFSTDRAALVIERLHRIAQSSQQITASIGQTSRGPQVSRLVGSDRIA
jgi:hypothetical protein